MRGEWNGDVQVKFLMSRYVDAFPLVGVHHLPTRKCDGIANAASHLLYNEKFI